MDFIARATMTRLQQVYSIQARTLCVDWAASAVCNLARIEHKRGQIYFGRFRGAQTIVAFVVYGDVQPGPGRLRL